MYLYRIVVRTNNKMLALCFYVLILFWRKY